ncbi:MAG: beta-galactosidase [Planctomycetota bacterium]|nr:MAG: beta-galactosidase [Planctomycetota bacterium]
MARKQSLIANPALGAPLVLNASPAWQCPELTGFNRLAGRATLWPHRDAEAAREQQDPVRICLDGQWDFCLLGRPEDTPADFAQLKPESTLPWTKLAVPALWTMHGFDRPQYSNWRIPFTPVDSPKVPAANPTGLYRHRFTLPKDWRGRRVVLHFAGFEAACLSLWCNGQAVGLAKDGRVACEFDLTSHLTSGSNTIALQLIKWGDSTYIEDQDHWRQYGINRSVYLYATGPAFIEDLFCTADYEPNDGSGNFFLEMRLGGAGSAGYQLRAYLYDPRGKNLTKKALIAGIPWGLTAHSRPREPIAELRLSLPKVLPWSHESPQLYRVVAELVDPQGKVVEATSTRCGFRRVEIVDRELRLNGRMIYIKGVNRHDHHDSTGKVLKREDILSDLRAMKAHHINAIRCSHYPNDPLFYDLCDELGFLVIDETNLEAHHTYARTAHDPRYAAAFLDRAMRMVLRDRNHPCIIAWSLGNETGFGPNHSAMAGWIRHIDPSRVMHYEGAICRANSEWDQGHAVTDIICPMYPQIHEIVQWAKESDDPRPLIMSEYSHAMGNSNGSLADYWEAIRSHHGLQGGFIWEWIDHGLRKTTEQGEVYWAYGGDFGDFPNDGNFVCDGLVWPDRQPHPAMTEVKRLFQPLQGQLLDPIGAVLIASEYAFTTTAHLNGSYRLCADGVEVASGTLPAMAIKPGESQILCFSAEAERKLKSAGKSAGKALQVCSTLPPLDPQLDYHLELSWLDRRDQPLLGRQYPCAQLQFPLQLAPRALSLPASSKARMETKEDTSGLHISADDWQFHFDTEGRLALWTVAGCRLICGGLVPTVWHAPTENEGIRAADYRAGAEDKGESGFKLSNKLVGGWYRAGLHACQYRLDALRWRAGAQGVSIRIRGNLLNAHGQPVLSEERVMTVDHAGGLSCQHRFRVGKDFTDLPRLGVVMDVAAGLEQMEWFGHGPGESYRDRLLGSPVGRYASAVADRYVPYIMPQEHGNIAGLRWLALRAANGHGFVAHAAGRIEGKATLISDANLSESHHTTGVRFMDHCHLHLDVAQRGLGTGSCGPDTLPQYRLTCGVHSLAYRLQHLGPKDDVGKL